MHRRIIKVGEQNASNKCFRTLNILLSFCVCECLFTRIGVCSCVHQTEIYSREREKNKCTHTGKQDSLYVSLFNNWLSFVHLTLSPLTLYACHTDEMFHWYTLRRLFNLSFILHSTKLLHLKLLFFYSAALDVIWWVLFFTLHLSSCVRVLHITRPLSIKCSSWCIFVSSVCLSDLMRVKC